MDPLTHALASYSLQRAAFPRISRAATIAVVLAGMIADVDLLSTSFGPSAYLTFNRTYFHSLLAALVFSLPATLPFFFLKPKGAQQQTARAAIFAAALAAALLHLALDSCQTSGVELLWPFSTRRFAMDWLPSLDLWVLGILLAGVLLPLLSGLVTEEIGARHKGPRGRLGATLALAALLLYLVVRLVLHGDAIAALESRTYRGELPHKVAAFAESSSPFRWHGIVETERALHELEVPVGPGADFDASSAITTYKPEPSPGLDAARNSTVARRFLQVARFPKATVEQTPAGFHVILRAFPYSRDSGSGLRVQALIDTDPSGKILSEELAWVPTSRDFWWHQASPPPNHHSERSEVLCPIERFSLDESLFNLSLVFQRKIALDNFYSSASTRARKYCGVWSAAALLPLSCFSGHPLAPRRCYILPTFRINHLRQSNLATTLF
jgi:membrane-bound metal-dependent hydrolase YbcI (DUF457 family)